MTTQPPMIPLAECQDRRLYVIYSRNLTAGVFRAETGGFIGIREKFGERYLFEEFHWERDSHLGTVRPEEALDIVLPPEIFLGERLAGPNGETIQCGVCHRWAEQYAGTYRGAEVTIDRTVKPWVDRPLYRHIDPPDTCAAEGKTCEHDVCVAEGDKIGKAYMVSNTALLEFLERNTIQPSDWLPDNH